MAIRMVAHFMPNDPILRRKASLRAVAVASTAVRVCAWAMIPAVILGAQCAFVSATSLGVTVWARVVYDVSGETLHTIKSLPRRISSSNTLLSNAYLSTVQKASDEVPPRRLQMQPSLTETNKIIAISEKRRIADLQAKLAKAGPQEALDIEMCDA